VTSLADVLQVGDVIYTELTDQPGQVLLSQLPGVEGALVSMQPKTGAILALVGGFDFHRSKFNRVTQARRQPGSNFKPFIYSAALENGDTAATIYNDAPVVFHDSALEGEWRPENYSGRFYGPTRLREALVKSRNLVSIRVLRGLGLRKSLDYVARFGFDIAKLPADLSLALGSGSVTPLQLVNGYSVFANQGYLTTPYFIDRIEDAFGETIFTAPDVILCDQVCEDEAAVAESGPSSEEVLKVSLAEENEAEVEAVADSGDMPSQSESDENPEEEQGARFEKVEKGLIRAPAVIDERNAYIMANILREVITRGTGRKALVLNRKDIAGKTGTTNDQHDAWFSGFNSEVATSVWVGYDELEPLGAKETGGQAALPMWIDYMKVALDDMPEDTFTQPARMVTVRIDKKTGELTNGRNPESMFEIFTVERAPSAMLTSTSSDDKRKKPSQQGSGGFGKRAPEPQEQLF
ncbi:MAG: peptidase, partial [Gammaproteobacteria bacterium]|nr:peptidase [Gammaproteobacteria bacterium]